MEHLKRLLVCVKDPAKDLRMLDYADRISRGEVSGRQFHVLHVQEEQPGADLAGDTPPLTMGELQSQVLAYGDRNGNVPAGEVVCAVVTGPTPVEILRYAMENDIDCLLVGCAPNGRRGAAGGAGLARRLARKATCSVLVVPENARLRVSHVLVPIRDTDCSARATQVACTVASGVRAGVSCLNVFSMGSGHSKTGRSLDEVIERLKTVAEQEARRMLVRVETDGASPEVRVALDPHSSPVEIILEECEKTGADLIVIGSRGRTGAAGVLLGKVTEQLIAECRLPVLAVKRKGEQIGILQALLSLA